MAYPGDGWHPRWTPYRILVLSTTISLGTAKAIATQKGGSVLPTTLEWISGVVLFIAFFVTSRYDSEESNSPYFSWIFKIDCMDYVWDLCSSFGFRRPFYATSESPFSNLEDSELPLVTLYRLTVSFSVMLFGMSKAVLSYFGRSTSANWIDWLLGTFMSSIFYCWSLYENNSANLYSWFFVTDRSEYLHPSQANKGMIFIGCSLFIGAWIWMCAYSWMTALGDKTPRFPAAHHRAGSSSVQSVFETFHDKIMDLGVSIIFLIMILCGVAAFLLMTYVMWSYDSFTVERYRRYGRRGIMARACGLIFSYLGSALRSVLAFRRLITGRNKVLRFLISFTFLIHAVGIVLLGCISATLIGICVRIYDPGMFDGAQGESLTVFIVLSLFLGSLGVLCMGMMFLVMWSLVYFFKSYKVN